MTKKGPKTAEGQWKKEVFLDGRLSRKKEFDRQIGIKPKLPSQIKRAKKQQERLKNLHKFP
jgi:hypothetical protein